MSIIYVLLIAFGFITGFIIFPLLFCNKLSNILIVVFVIVTVMILILCIYNHVIRL